MIKLMPIGLKTSSSSKEVERATKKFVEARSNIDISFSEKQYTLEELQHSLYLVITGNIKRCDIENINEVPIRTVARYITKYNDLLITKYSYLTPDKVKEYSKNPINSSNVLNTIKELGLVHY